MQRRTLSAPFGQRRRPLRLPCAEQPTGCSQAAAAAAGRGPQTDRCQAKPLAEGQSHPWPLTVGKVSLHK